MSKSIQFKCGENENAYVHPFWPIGSIYLSLDETNPSKWFGGTWERIKDRFLLACGDAYAKGATGGEATHKLTTAEMPYHEHWQTARTGDGNINPLAGSDSGGSYGAATQYGGGWGWTNYATGYMFTGGNGSGQSHNNMPPYLAVYVWKRVA